MAEREPDNDEWIETVVKITGALGFNQMRMRWKLRRWQERRRQAARRHEQKVEHIRYEHKTCDVCGAVQDKDEKVCSRCEAKLGRREFQVLRRMGLTMPQALSFSTLLSLAIVAVHIRVMIASEGAIISPPIIVLLHFGGHFTPLVADEPWRLLTSMFLHAGIWHIAFNLIAIAMVGPRVEETYGRSTMLFIFIVTGVLANIGSGAVGLQGVGIGASGGVMGLIGAMAGYGHRDGTWGGRALRNDMLKWTAYTIVFGFFIGADNWAHLFGALTGGAFGYAVKPRQWTARALAPLRIIAGVIAGAAAIGALVLIFTRGAPNAAPYEQEYTYEYAYAPYAKGCRKHYDGDRAGALKELEVLPHRGPVEMRAEDIDDMCNSFLLTRDFCRKGLTGSAAVDPEICRLIELAFGDFPEQAKLPPDP